MKLVIALCGLMLVPWASVSADDASQEAEREKRKGLVIAACTWTEAEPFHGLLENLELPSEACEEAIRDLGELVCSSSKCFVCLGFVPGLMLKMPILHDGWDRVTTTWPGFDAYWYDGSPFIDFGHYDLTISVSGQIQNCPDIWAGN